MDWLVAILIDMYIYLIGEKRRVLCTMYFSFES